MVNQDLKQEMKQNGVPQWKVAYEMGVSEMTLIRKMRFELSAEDKQRVLSAINNLSAQKGSACNHQKTDT